MRESESGRMRLVGAGLALALVAGCGGSGSGPARPAPPAAGEPSPAASGPLPTGAPDTVYRRGPEPTLALLSRGTGPFAVARSRVGSGHGFREATVYHPVTRADGRFGAVAISPGWTGRWSQLAWLGPRLASHGFVVIGIDTLSPEDFPGVRADQLLAALDHLTRVSPVRDRVDPGRLAVAGHSMGGGGALEAAARRPRLRAAVPVTPWHVHHDFASVAVPTLVIGAEHDTTAAAGRYAVPMVESLPVSGEHAYLEIAGADHLVPLSRHDLLAGAMISWLKVFVDGDTRYLRFLCPGPDGPDVAVYRATCPLVPPPFAR